MRVVQEDTTYQGLVTFLVLPFKHVDTFKPIAIPKVSNIEVFISSGSVITITSFLGGADGQEIKILGDGNTTISNNTKIKTNTGANKLLAANKVYRFTYFQSLDLWVEDA